MLTGSNTHSGGTIVNQGMLTVSRLGGVNSLGSAPVTLGGGTLRLAGQSPPSVQQQIVAASGYNQDLVWSLAEKSLSYTAATTAQIASWDWYEHGVIGSQGLPVDDGSATARSPHAPSMRACNSNLRRMAPSPHETIMG